MPSEHELLRLSPREAFERVEHDAHCYVDVSSVPEFEQGHPAGAYNVPLRQPGPDGMADNPEFLRVMQTCFGADTPLVLGCQSGERSLAAARLLLQAGFRRVVEQRAGFSGARGVFGQLLEPGWLAAALPSSVGPEPGRDYAALRARAARG